jgi:uncharacterized membrane protein YphA (DoxX/SURF4 family)
MDIVIWVIQWVLALAFIAAGLMKAVRPIDKLAERMEWVRTSKPATVRFIGVAEVMGGLGLVLPMLTGIAVVLTPVAAVALALVMLLAAITHFRSNDAKGAAPSIVLMVLTLIVAIARF